MDGWSWTEVIGQLLGGAVGVVIGYAASEVISALRKRSDERGMRFAVQTEVLQNAVLARSILTDLDLGVLERGIQPGTDREDLISIRGRTFFALPEPEFSSIVWERQFSLSPGVFSVGEASRLLDVHQDARHVVAAWREYQHARTREHADRAPSTVPHMYPPLWLDMAIEKLQPNVEKRLQRIVQAGYLSRPIIKPDPTLADRWRVSVLIPFQVWKSRRVMRSKRTSSDPSAQSQHTRERPTGESKQAEPPAPDQSS